MNEKGVKMQEKNVQGKKKQEKKVQGNKSQENRIQGKQVQEARAETEGGKVWKTGSETAVWPERGKGKEER